MLVVPLTLALFTAYLDVATAWTYTEYRQWGPMDDPFYYGSTTTVPWTVSPTGPVSPTSTNITTTQTVLNFASGAAYFNITVTDLFVGPNASVCTPNGYSFTCKASTTTATPTEEITTSIWAAVTISNPPSCTRTAFTYTTSSRDGLKNIDYYPTFPGIYSQAADTGPAGEALFVTTYVSTVSVNLGGQAITRMQCDIWLKPDAMASIGPDEGERYYLKNCVDPRRYRCYGTGTLIQQSDCGTDWIGTYPMTPGATVGVVTGTGSSPAATKSSGVTGGRRHEGMVLATLTAIAAFAFLFC